MTHFVTSTAGQDKKKMSNVRVAESFGHLSSISCFIRTFEGRLHYKLSKGTDKILAMNDRMYTFSPVSAVGLVVSRGVGWVVISGVGDAEAVVGVGVGVVPTVASVVVAVVDVASSCRKCENKQAQENISDIRNRHFLAFPLFFSWFIHTDRESTSWNS